jgi:GWxTD domain-containing protein
MHHIRTILIRGLLLVLATALIASFAFAQTTPPTDARETARKQKKPERNPSLDWAEKDVGPIITPEELAAWKKLKTEEEREAFRKIFWDLRDTDPDTEENEYRTAYYERFAYVNEHYTSGRPGYLTDRGRIYLIHGKPDEIESHPSGGSYVMPSYQGGDTITAYPFEIWFYRHVADVGSGIELEFVDRSGSGDYRLVNSADEKNALANVPGQRQSAGLANINTSGFQRAQDNPIEIMLIQTGMLRAPRVDFTPDTIAGSNALIDNSGQIAVGVRVDSFRQSDQSGVAAITVQTSNSDLTFVPSGGAESARLNIFGRITAVDGRPVANFQDAVTTNATTAELIDIKGRKSAYQKVIALRPGFYKVDILVRDLNSNTVGIQKIGFEIPKFNTASVALSSLVLATRLENMGSRPPGGMFTIGDKKVLPNLSGEFRQGQGVGLYAQIYNATIDQITLRPAVEVNYSIRKNGAEVFHQIEDWNGMGDSGQRLNLARIFSTAALTPGAYQLVVMVKDQVSGQTLQQAADFSIIK